MKKLMVPSLLLCLISSSVIAENADKVKEDSYSEAKLELNEARREARNATKTGDVIATKELSNNQKLDKKWQHALPFYAQNAIDLGFDLPLPFSFSIIPTYTQQTIGFNNLDVKVGDKSLGDSVNLGQIDFGNPDVKTATLQLRAGAWLFPFMQIGAHAGRFQGNTDLNVNIPGSVFPGSVSDHLAGSNVTCNRFNDMCGDRLSEALGQIPTLSFSPEYQGWNYGLSTNLVAGFGEYFAVLPVSYTWSHTDDGRTSSQTLAVSPRIGRSYHIENWGLISPYIGVSYLHTTGTTSETNALGIEGLGYSIDQQNENDWSGLNWNLARHYGVAAEASLGQGRKSVMAMLTYRW
ncbi:hypothetical protein [Vibrio sp. 10N.261.51.F12]|uniref:hypothetical protein n=1 Tax=Vibrio sp. 10N.261.51.F12 TaxID=3229679 RepID=UPI00354D9A5E